MSERYVQQMKKEVTVNMKSGFEARPIANMVQLANRYDSTIYLEVEGKRVNAKSIMGMMSLALLEGEKVSLDVCGEDEAEAIRALEEFLSE